MAWHRDSLGLLVQRFFFSIIIMSSLVTFKRCSDTHSSDGLKECFYSTGTPLIVVLVFVTLKVVCLRQ